MAFHPYHQRRREDHGQRECCAFSEAETYSPDDVQNIHGYLQSRVVFFLMNIHNRFRTIYFARVQ